MNTIIFILGLEGSGHHALASLLSQFFVREDVDYQEGEWHYELINTWRDKKEKYGFKNRIYLNHMTNRLSVFEQEKIHERIACKMKEDDMINYYVEMCSFPFGASRKLERSPDLEYFHLVFSKYFKIKYINMKRDIGDCVISALRRGFSESSYEQFKIARWNQAYLEFFMSKYEDTISVLDINYDVLIKEPEIISNQVGDFIGENIVYKKGSIKKPKEKSTELQSILHYINLLEK
jgi:hypothetical protein